MEMEEPTLPVTPFNHNQNTTTSSASPREETPTEEALVPSPPSGSKNSSSNSNSPTAAPHALPPAEVAIASVDAASAIAAATAAATAAAAAGSSPTTPTTTALLTTAMAQVTLESSTPPLTTTAAGSPATATASPTNLRTVSITTTLRGRGAVRPIVSPIVASTGGSNGGVPVVVGATTPTNNTNATATASNHSNHRLMVHSSSSMTTNTIPMPSSAPSTPGGSNSLAPTSPQPPPLQQSSSSSLFHHATTPNSARGSTTATTPNANNFGLLLPPRSLNSANDINSRLDTQIEVRVYPCNNSAGPKKKYTTFTIKPEGVVIQGSNRNRPGPNNNNTNANNMSLDLGTEYAAHIGRKLQRYELSDNRACQLLVTTHAKSFWVVPAPEAFSRHSGTCRLLGDRKHPPAPHTMQVGDFLRVGSVGIVVIETHDGVTNCVLSEEKIQRIMKDTTATGGFLDLAETDGENSDDSLDGGEATHRSIGPDMAVGTSGDNPVCYMCFDEENTEENPMITPCKCSGDTKFVHVECLRKWHTAEADNQICFLSSVDATCSVCKSTFKSDFKLRDGRQVKLFKSSLEPPYVSLLVATKHEMAQRLFNTRFQLSYSTLMKPDGRNAIRPLLLGRSSGSDMVLDYRTVSARHAAIRFKNGEFIFTDAGSSNGSYLYLRRPLELSPSQAVQFRLGRSMISMKVVNKWNRRLLRAVRGQRAGVGSGFESDEANGGVPDDRSIGSTDGDIRIAASDQTVTAIQRRTRDSVMAAMPPAGQLSQSSSKHLDLLYALAYPKREIKTSNNSGHKLERSNKERKEDDEEEQEAVEP